MARRAAKAISGIRARAIRLWKTPAPFAPANVGTCKATTLEFAISEVPSPATWRILAVSKNFKRKELYKNNSAFGLRPEQPQNRFRLGARTAYERARRGHRHIAAGLYHR